MVTAVCEAVVSQWNAPEDDLGISLATDVETFLLGQKVHPEASSIQSARAEDPEVFALTRQRYPSEIPSGKRLEQVKQTMLRIHRAAGHTSMQNLQQMLRSRQAPQWAIELAGKLTCPDCQEAKRLRPAPPASSHEMPGLFEQVGTDCFELEFLDSGAQQSLKAKFILWRDRASGLAQTDLLQIYSGSWEPKSSDVIKSLGKWLMNNPTPRWIISDAATYYTSEAMVEYLGRSGIGLLTAPAEAHWVLGYEEGCIGILKATWQRMLKETPKIGIEGVMHLATHAHNQSIGPSGFSPFQWTRGAIAPDEGALQVGLNPSKAFDGMLALKAKAKAAFEKEYARSRLSKLSNATGRPPGHY